MKNILIIAIWLCAVSCLQAQMNIGGEPYSFSHDLSVQKSAAKEVMPGINLTKIAEEDLVDEAAGLPPRFGYPFEVDLNLNNSGQWEVLDTGDRIWRLTIEAPDASSINLSYSDFWLPEGATLYIYNEDRTSVIGGFTRKNNKGFKEDNTAFGTAIILGDKVTLEYYEPAEVAGEGEIFISEVVHGYRFMSLADDLLKLFGDSDPCQNNINCAVGNDWQLEKTGVAMMTVGTSRFCTGALLNAYGDELVPYFLTADHCIGSLDATGNTNASNWVFYFRYESPTCTNPASDPINNAFAFAGARLIANLQDTDFALFRLLESPAPSNPVYLGWDAGIDPSSGTGIHHPSGDVMKISIENDDITNFGGNIGWDDGTTSPANTHWRVVFDDGGTEGGSSGSPLFDQNHRVVGQLHGGTGECPGDTGFRKYYGKFSVSWNGNGSSDRRRRLSDWIGPQCVGYRNITTTFTGEEPIIRANTMDAGNTVGSSAFVRYEASGWADLEVGFDALPGSDFRVSILGDCAAAARVDENGNAVYFTDTVTSDYTEIVPESKESNKRMEEERPVKSSTSKGTSKRLSPARPANRTNKDIKK